jgi:hypothetical protein
MTREGKRRLLNRSRLKVPDFNQLIAATTCQELTARQELQRRRPADFVSFEFGSDCTGNGIADPNHSIRSPDRDKPTVRPIRQ